MTSSSLTPPFNETEPTTLNNKLEYEKIKPGDPDVSFLFEDITEHEQPAVTPHKSPYWKTSSDPFPGNLPISPGAAAQFKTPVKDKTAQGKDDMQVEEQMVGGRKKQLKKRKHSTAKLEDEREEVMEAVFGPNQEAMKEGDKTDKKEEKTPPPSSAKTVVAETQVKEEEGQGEDDEEEEEDFDPSGPIEKFDSKGELLDQWDRIQREVTPELKKWAEETIENTMNMVYSMIHHFHVLNVQVQEELRQGVKEIEAKEAHHAHQRQQILDFHGRMAFVGQSIASNAKE